MNRWPLGSRSEKGSFPRENHRSCRRDRCVLRTVEMLLCTRRQALANIQPAYTGSAPGCDACVSTSHHLPCLLFSIDPFCSCLLHPNNSPHVQAVDNAKRLTEGDLDNLELAKGPAEVNRRRMVLNQVRCGAGAPCRLHCGVTLDGWTACYHVLGGFILFSFPLFCFLWSIFDNDECYRVSGGGLVVACDWC